MLVVISDLHISDGTTAHNVDPSALTLLENEILLMAKAKAAQEVHVLLLGDIFDLVRTSYWHEHVPRADDRPWGGKLDPLTGMNSSPAVQAQFEAVLRGVPGQPPSGVLNTPAGKRLLDLLNGLKARTQVPIKVTYVIGNHDRVFNNFESLKQIVIGALSGVDEVWFDIVFRSPEYGVLARHGHEWDENCHGWSFYNKVLRPGGKPQLDRFAPEAYRVMAIGEVVTAELMSGLVHYARTAPKPNTPDPAFIDAFKDINNIRPMLSVFAWLEWFGRDRLPAFKGVLFDALKRGLDGVLDSALAKRWDDLEVDLVLHGDLTDQLALIRKRGLGSSFDEFRARIAIVEKILDLKARLFPVPGADGYAAGAEREQEWEKWGGDPPGPIQYVLYGHTHQARHVAFEATLDQRVRMYINTGTLLPLIERTTTGKGFVTSSQMTMAFFCQKAEDTNGRADQGPTVYLWDGIQRKRYLPSQ